MPLGLTKFASYFLIDANGVPVGCVGADGNEYLFPTTVNTAGQGTSTGGGTRISSLIANLTADTTGTPGSFTTVAVSGRAAFAAASNSVVATHAAVTTSSRVFVQLETQDGTLTSCIVTCAAGSFTVTGNANATGITKFAWWLFR